MLRVTTITGLTEVATDDVMEEQECNAIVSDSGAALCLYPDTGILCNRRYQLSSIVIDMTFKYT